MSEKQASIRNTYINSGFSVVNGGKTAEEMNVPAMTLEMDVEMAHLTADAQPQVKRISYLPAALAATDSLWLLISAALTCGADMNVFMATSAIYLTLFFSMASVCRLFSLKESRYILGKMTTVSLGMLSGQSVFLAVTGTGLADTSWSLGLVALALGLAAVSHGVLTRNYSRGNTDSFYYRLERGLKRCLDIVLAGAGVLAILPLLTTVSLLIWLEDRGPILFSQDRMGCNGKRFRMLKFRSMCMNAEEKSEALRQKMSSGLGIFYMKDDPRITRVGKIIRKLSIDELPQLWHVLTGEMSLVGPRPFILPEFDKLKRIIGADRMDLDQTPGITGLWQVKGRTKNERSYHLVAAYDNEYIDNWCLLDDIWILLSTVPVVLLQKGAN